jgi:hypothetical protein
MWRTALIASTNSSGIVEPSMQRMIDVCATLRRRRADTSAASFR